MAVAITYLAEGTLSASPWTTASVSPTGEIKLNIQCADTSSTTVSSISGCGLTWSEVVSNLADWGGGNFREFVWKGIGTASSGTITVVFAGADPGYATYQIENITGHNTSGMFVQSPAPATGSSTTPSKTLSAFSDAGNATSGWTVVAAASANYVTAGSGFTELGEIRRTSFTMGMATEWRADNDTTVDATLVGSKTWYQYGFEIAVAAAGATDLVIADALHGHAADNIVLTQAHQLAISDTAHGHTADSLTITQLHQLVIQEALHAHAADNLSITQSHILVVADALHGHTADNLTLNLSTDLLIADSAHAHVADNIALTQAHVLVIDDAGHVHTADSLNLTQNHVLVISDALHSQLSDNITISVGDISTPASRIYVVDIDNRTYVVLREDRRYVIAAQNRTYTIH